MAAPTGQTQDTKTKKEITPEQRKLFTQLGIVGALALVAGGLHLSGVLSGGSSGTAVAPPVTPDATTTNAASGAAAPGAADPGPAASGAATGAAGGAAGAAPGAVNPGDGAPAPAAPGAPTLTRFSRDPFQQAYFLPTPTPLPPPVPPPVSVPAPDLAPFAVGGVGLPGGPAGNSPDAFASLHLPPVVIGRLNQSTSSSVDLLPPRRAGAGSNASPTVSTNRRLSGVVIGEGVRALLEIQNGTSTVTRVVQPGDEVEGITVLSIGRFNDGTRTVTRMIIRENGEERSVELRPAPQAAAATDGGDATP